MLYKIVQSAITKVNELQDDGTFEVKSRSSLVDDYELLFNGKLITFGKLETIGYYLAGIYAYLKLRRNGND